MEKGSRLAKLMPNIGGLRETKSSRERHALVNSLRFPCFGGCTKQVVIEKENGVRTERLIAIRIVSSYSTVSESAIMVFTRVPPIDLKYNERKEF